MGIEENKSPSQTNRGLINSNHSKDQKWRGNDQNYVHGMIEPNKPVMEYENGMEGIDQNANMYGGNSLI